MFLVATAQAERGMALQGSHYLLVLMTMARLVRCDYPPPAEDRHGYYSRKHHGSSAVGAGEGYLSDWNSKDWELLGNPNPGKCINIPSDLTLCRGIGYEQMRLPNLLEHDTLKEVSQQASSWVRLLGLRCHADTQIFLCSLFAPVCLERPIWPCRSLCEAVKAGCEDRMLKYGFPWPEMLRCNQYPSEDDLCIGLRNENNREAESTCSSCLVNTFESTVDDYCRADFAMRIKIKQAIVTGSDMKIDTDKKKKIYKTGSLKTSDIREASLYIVNGSSCDCPTLDGGIGKAKNSSSFIVMGSKIGDRFVLSFVQRIDNASKEVNRALRVIRKPDVCTKTAAIDAKKNVETGAAPTVVKKGTGAQEIGKSKGKNAPSGKGGRKSSSSERKHRTTIKNGATTPSTVKKAQNTGREKKSKKSHAVTPLFY